MHARLSRTSADFMFGLMKRNLPGCLPEGWRSSNVMVNRAMAASAGCTFGTPFPRDAPGTERDALPSSEARVHGPQGGFAAARPANTERRSWPRRTSVLHARAHRRLRLYLFLSGVRRWSVVALVTGGCLAWCVVWRVTLTLVRHVSTGTVFECHAVTSCSTAHRHVDDHLHADGS